MWEIIDLLFQTGLYKTEPSLGLRPVSIPKPTVVEQRAIYRDRFFLSLIKYILNIRRHSTQWARLISRAWKSVWRNTFPAMSWRKWSESFMADRMSEFHNISVFGFRLNKYCFLLLLLNPPEYKYIIATFYISDTFFISHYSIYGIYFNLNWLNVLISIILLSISPHSFHCISSTLRSIQVPHYHLLRYIIYSKPLYSLDYKP